MKRNSSIILGTASLAVGLLATAAFAGNYEQAVMSLNPSYYWQLDEADGTSRTSEHPLTGNTLQAYRYNQLEPQNVGHGKYDIPGIVNRAVYMNPDPHLGVGLLDGQSTAGLGYPGSMTSPGFNPAGSIGGGYTVQFWMNPTFHASNAFSANANTAPGGDSHAYGFSFGLYNDGTQAFFDLWDTPTGGNTPGNMDPRFVITNDGIINGQWNFVTMTFQRTGLTTLDSFLYVNGQLKGGGSLTGLDATDFGNWNYVNFGGNATGGLDEISIFNYALSQQQILQEFNAVPEPGMLSLLALGGAFMVWRRKVAAKRA